MTTLTVTYTDTGKTVEVAAVPPRATDHPAWSLFNSLVPDPDATPEGYELSQSANGFAYSPRKVFVEFFCDPNVHNIKFARTSDGEWFCVPSVHDGWHKRYPWHPSEALAKHAARNWHRVTYYGRDWHAEYCIGLPHGMLMKFEAAA